MSEGMDLLHKMQSMPGMDNMQKMFSQMGLGGKGGKFNMGAMEAQMNKNMNAAKMKERMKAKATANASASASFKQFENTNVKQTAPLYSEEEIVKIFSTGEKVEKTPRGAKPPTTGLDVEETNKKSGKNKDRKKKK